MISSLPWKIKTIDEITICDRFDAIVCNVRYSNAEYIVEAVNNYDAQNKYIHELERDYISTKRIICLILKQIGGKIEIPIIDMIQTNFKDYELLYADNEKNESKIIALKEVQE
jgi:hypothetical protein